MCAAMSEQGLCPERAPVARRRSARRASRAAHAAPHVTQASVDAPLPSASETANDHIMNCKAHSQRGGKIGILAAGGKA